MAIADIFKANHEFIKQLVECKTYQLFLTLYLSESKKHTKSVSLGQLAMKSGLSKSLIKGVMDGTKRITPKTMGPIRKALNLPPLLNEYFYYLVAQEVPEILETTSGKVKNLTKKYGQLVLEEYAAADNTDEFFKNPNNPIIYAALGSFEEGVSRKDILRKSLLPEAEVSKSLSHLVSIGAAKETEGIFLANRQFMFRTSAKTNSNFHQYFLHTLAIQEQVARRKFEDTAKLFYSNVFSIQESDMRDLRDDLLKLLNLYVQKSENPTGDKIVTLQASLF